MRKELGGQAFGRLVVLRRAPGNNRWICCCACGTLKDVRGDHLRRGKILSCGCLRRERVHTTHGMTRGGPTREYRAWQHMKGRCLTPTDKAFRLYGARGISVCERWISDFRAFLEDMGPCPTGYTLDRINNDGPYSPDNCRWATRREQAINTRRTRLVDFGGQRICLKELAARFGVSYQYLHTRFKSGEDPVAVAARLSGK